ncbi:hypothetical protein A7U60_g7332 [Sanghuangporus baumii]|uniref:F-box domain-containing protein n=1 Tax=Sanghuangporus baumii TaxID=108892 RepID=A0A9Q5N5G2_SANBA|nr:hypothetical protein A7U60_g7332 [Sanghuangporus baumii]
MARKKRKTQHDTTDADMSPPKRDLISTLPWELIAEILSMTTPKEVLALARCSRHFCDSLVINPRSKCIWESARMHCRPKIPDPTPNFTEPAYAAYIFDGGPCEMYRAMRERSLLGSYFRFRTIATKSGRSREKVFRFPDTPSKEEFVVKDWVIGLEGEHFRKSDFLQALSEYRRLRQGKSRINREHHYYMLRKKCVYRKRAILVLSGSLLDWTSQRAELAIVIKKGNLGVLERLALLEGWDLTGVLNSPTCNEFYKWHNRALEYVQLRNFNVIKSDIEAEIMKQAKKRARTKEEQAYSKRRELMAQEYYRRKSIGSSRSKPVILPNLNVFRRQSMIKLLQNRRGSDPDKLASSLRHPSTRRMIDDDLSFWGSKANFEFKKILGADDFFQISKKKLDPLEKLTARFICTRCLDHTSDESKIPPLDFREACAHQCKHLTKKQRARTTWSPKQFIPDQKAICATRKLLALLNVSEDLRESLQKIDANHNRILCRNCDGKTVMNFRAMVGIRLSISALHRVMAINQQQRHSHRHEDMDMEFLTPQQVKKLPSQPIQWGLCAELTSMAKSAPRKAELKIYGCRHCLQQDDLEQEPAEDKMDLDERNSRTKKSDKGDKRLRLMSFHGTRCHVLQSHGISRLSDEDIFRVDSEA